MATNYIFIGDRIEFEDSNTFDLGFNHTLRRPTDVEVVEIRKQIKSYFEITNSGYFNRYEQYEKKISDTNSTFHRIEKSEDFKYSVIEQPMNWMLYYESIDIVFNISKFDFTQIFNFRYATQKNEETGKQELSQYGGSGKMLSRSMYNYFDEFSANFKIKKINKSISEDIVKLHEQVKLFLDKKDEYQHVYKALQDFKAHKEISNKSPFKLIVLIACLEGLLTDGSLNRTTSINRQLQTKLNLINNRCLNPIDFRKYITGPDTLRLEKVIESIYAYRSKIAHGDVLEFKKSLAILENIEFETILEFVLDLSKLVFEFSIKEPKLIVDLKQI